MLAFWQDVSPHKKAVKYNTAELAFLSQPQPQEENAACTREFHCPDYFLRILKAKENIPEELKEITVLIAFSSLTMCVFLTQKYPRGNVEWNCSL